MNAIKSKYKNCFINYRRRLNNNKHILLETNNIRGQYCNLHSKSLQNGPDVKKCIELNVYIYPWLQGYYISRTLDINTVNATINIE